MHHSNYSYVRRRCAYTPLELPAVLSEGTGPKMLDCNRRKKDFLPGCLRSESGPPLNVKSGGAANDEHVGGHRWPHHPTAFISCCHDGTPDQGPDTTAKDRVDASALRPPLAHFAYPLLTPSRDIVVVVLCCRSGLHVWAWGKMQAKSTPLRFKQLSFIDMFARLLCRQLDLSLGSILAILKPEYFSQQH